MKLKPNPIRVLCLLSFLLAGLSGCGSQSGEPIEKSATKAKAALTVTVVSLRTESWSQNVAASGNVAAWQETVIGSEIGGLRLAQVLVNVGETVRAGQMLATFSSAPVEADLAQSRAAVVESQAAFAEAQANGDRARKFQKSGAISQQQITQYLTAEQTAKARIDVAKARQHADELRLQQTRIVAPDDGVVSARAATVGTVAAVGQELFRLILRGRLEWRAEVAAADIERIKIGAPASLTLASGAKVKGKVRALAPSIDPQTRNGIVFVDLLPGVARAGMFARGEIVLAEAPALSLPQSAVLLRDGFSWVFKLSNEQKVVQSKVVTGRRQGDQVEITSGISMEDKVVASGVGFLADGDLVDVVEVIDSARQAS